MSEEIKNLTIVWWKKRKIWIAVAIFLFVVVPWIFVLFLGVSSIETNSNPNKVTSLAQYGQIGDIFGSVNALFSGLAFAALIYTICLQRKELALQRIELRLQRKEMKASRGELAAQVAVQKSLCLATIAQIKVAAEQARIEHNKMYSDANSAKNIEEIANKIDEIANGLENSFKTNLTRNK